MQYDFGNGTDKGCVRAKNEDSFALYKPNTARQMLRKGHLLVVCDGMGGANAGKTASAMAAELISAHYYTDEIDDPRNALVAAIKLANKEIWNKAGEKPELFGMGTTVVAAAVVNQQAFVAHVGDSRAYKVNEKGIINQLTEDHTMVQRMVRRGIITSDEAESHNERHMLSRAVGVEDDVEIDITMEPVRLEAGDALVLCSDGLTNVVEEDEIQQLVTTKSAQTAVERLIQLAKERGAPDNVTVQIIKSNSNDIEEEDEDIGATTIQTAPRESFPKLLIIAVALVGLVALSFFLVWLFTML